jgi:hypothetical protein
VKKDPELLLDAASTRGRILRDTEPPFLESGIVEQKDGCALVTRSIGKA